MKVLSVRQPWAHALIHLGKRIENRTWTTRHRGPLGIHASQSLAEFARDYSTLMPDLPPREELVLGAVIGIVDLVDIRPFEEVQDDPFAEGPWCWITANPQPIEPIPMPGRLQLFEIDRGRVRFIEAEAPAQTTA
jgi:ASCH domain